MERKIVVNIFWFLIVAPFMTAAPLYFLMPEKLSSEVDVFGLTGFWRHRMQIFGIPLVFFLVGCLVYLISHLIGRRLKRGQRILSGVLAAIGFALCIAAIGMELTLYRMSMMIV